MSLDIFRLDGKIALITGGSRGLGKAMARGFVQAGADVVITSRHESELQVALPEILKATDRKGETIVADMSKRDDVSRLASEAVERMGKIDILVNNAGASVPQTLENITDQDWDRVVEINLTSIMMLTRGLAPQMIQRKWGRVIHISSIMGLISKSGRAGYSTTKSALIGLARANALDLGPHGVTVNCLAPGPFLTDLPKSVLSEADQKKFADRTALGRWGEPEELVGPALLLASDAGRYITGETLVVDGGFTAQ